MSDGFKTIYIWFTMLVTVGVIAVMLVMGKPSDETVAADLPATETEPAERTFIEATDDLAENSLKFYLPADIQEQHVTIENDYMEKTLRFSFAKQPEGQMAEVYFYDNPMQINAVVGEAEISESVEQVTIELPFESMFEWELKFEKEGGQNCMYVQLVRPRNKYEKIVVLDAGHGGTDLGYTVAGEDETLLLQEKELVLAVVEKAGKLLEKEGVCVYYTRKEDENPTDQQRVGLANETQADMFISVHADHADDTTLYGMRTIYNETYFIPNFASADLAYLLLEKVAASTNEKAIGFEPGTSEIHLVQNAMVPVAQLYIGYLSNRQEQKLLSREDYIERIAQGICDAVLAGYEEIEK